MATGFGRIGITKDSEQGTSKAGSSFSGGGFSRVGFSKDSTKKKKAATGFGRIGLSKDTDEEELSTLEKQNVSMANRLTEQGYGSAVPDLKAKAFTTLEKVADLLSRGQYAGVGATAALMGNVDESAVEAFVKGLKGEKKYSTEKDILKGMEDGWGKKIAGFAGDVLLDPTTYLTLGAGGVAKAGGVSLTKAGVKALGKEGLKLGTREAVEAALKKAAKKEGVDAAKYIAKAGLRAELPFIGGKTLVTGEQVGKMVSPVAEAALKVGKQVPIVREGIAAGKIAKDTVGGLFKTGYGLDPGYNAIRNRYRDLTRYGRSQAIERALELGKGLTPEQRKLVTMGIEQGSEFAYKGADAKVVNDAIGTYRKAFKDLADLEVKEGILDAGQVIDNYVPHYYQEHKDKLLSVLRNIDQPARVPAGFTKARKIKTLEDAKKFGLTPEMDVAGLYAQRAVASDKAVQSKRMLDEITSQFGQKVKKHAVESGGKKRFVFDRLPGYETVDEIKELAGYQFPREIANDLRKFHKSFAQKGTAAGNILRGYDKLLNYWKGMVTGVVPAYHTTNMMGNLFNNWLGGVNNPVPYLLATRAQANALKGGTEAIKGVLKTPAGEIPMREVVEAAERYLSKGFYGGDIIEEVPKQVTQGLKSAPRRVAETFLPWKAPGNIAAAGRKVGGTIEGNARLAHFIDKVAKGYSFEDAAQSVKKYLFDYEELTDFEKGFMKRVVPFYTWMRNNIPLQIEQMVKNPRKPATLPKIQRMIEGEEGAQAREKEKGLVPDYLREQFTIRTGKDAKGNPIYTRVAIPWGDFAKITDPKEWVGALAPTIKIPTELFFNKESYFGRDIENKNLPKELRTVKAPSFLASDKVPEAVKKWLNVREVERENKTTGETYTRVEADALKLYILKNVILPRVFGEASKITNEDIEPGRRVRGFISPIKDTPVDLEQEQFYQQMDANNQLSETVSRLLRENKIPELPKGRKKKTFKSAEQRAAEKLMMQRLGLQE